MPDFAPSDPEAERRREEERAKRAVEIGEPEMQNREAGEYLPPPERKKDPEAERREHEDWLRRQAEEGRKKWDRPIREEETAEYKARAEKLRQEAQAEAMRKMDREHREQLKAADRDYERLRQEKAPDHLVRSLIKEKCRLDLGEGAEADLETAIPNLAAELRKDPDAVYAAAGLENDLKVLKNLAEQSLMFGGDYAGYLDKLAEELKQRAFSEARRNKLDLQALSALPTETGKEEAAPEAPKNALEAALAENGLTLSEVEKAIADMPDQGGLINPKKMTQNSLNSIKERLAAGALPKDDEGLRGGIFHFVEQMKRQIKGK